MRRRYPSVATALTAMIAQACGLFASDRDVSDHRVQAAGSAGQSSGGTTAAGSGGSAGISLIDTGGSSQAGRPNTCPRDVLFADQVVDAVGGTRIFYSWTTDEQVAELRAGTELFSRSERAGMGRGLLFTELAALAAAGTTPASALADALVNKTFAKARFAWPNPWATLLGFPGETYGNQLLRIDLKADAWIARFDRGKLDVVDAKDQPVPLETALASPERIGAIFYQSHAVPGISDCYFGTFSHSAGVGFREFALGNIDMVERWSLATPEISERLDRDLAELKAFEAQIPCLTIASDWPGAIGCEWERSVDRESVASTYDFALGLPSELYLPNPENIAALIATLELSMPTGEPLVVTPGQ